MKPLFIFLTVLTFSNSIVGYAVDHDYSKGHSHLIRAPTGEPGGEERPPPREVPEQIPEPKAPLVEPQPDSQPKGGILPGGIATFQSIKTSIQALTTPKWVTYVMTKTQALARLLGFRTGFTGDPKDLIETNEFGYPLSADTKDLTENVKSLKEVKYSGGRMWTWTGYNDPVYEHVVGSGEKTQIGFSYSTKYYSPRDAVSTFLVNGKVLDINPIGVASKKRAISLNDLDGSANSNTTQSLTPAAEFQAYLDIFYAAQAAIAAVIRPVLNNITAQTNSTLIHDMADSIYYDLTGSTTVLIGPFNYGMSFLNDSVTASNITSFITAVEGIYAGMWVTAYLAANSTGMFQQLLDVAGVLNTNDTSVFPPGFTTVSKDVGNT